MTKRIFALICVLLILQANVVWAKNTVHEINIDVTIMDDGSAYIVQEWRGVFNEGTENYIPINTRGITIDNLKISDEHTQYSFISDWNVGASFEEKIHSCGIVQTDDGIELCFGISEYGKKRYTIEYIIRDFIKGYTDADGVNFMFVNPYMSTFPTDVRCRILLQNGTELNEDNAKIWAFGYSGEIEFSTGDVVAYTTKALDNDNSMIVMLELKKGLINPLMQLDESFEEVRADAFEQSDYEQDSVFEDVIFRIVIGIILAIGLSCIIYTIKRKRAIKSFYKAAEYFRDVPNRGDIALSNLLAEKFDMVKDKSLIIGALLLKMINSRSIECFEEKSVGIFGKEKSCINLRLVSEPSSEPERELYSIVKNAAGEDGILQEKELKKYSASHPEKIENLIKDAAENAEARLITMKGFRHSLGTIQNLTDIGKRELSEAMGLKKYLEDFSLIHERSVFEGVIWQDYLVYAYLFGIGDKVIEEFKSFCPEGIEELDDYTRSVIVVNSYSRTMYTSHRAALQQARSSGHGGMASIGGGGGFSGGGVGGGSR